MIKVLTQATVWYSCELNDKDEEMVLKEIKNRGLDTSDEHDMLSVIEDLDNSCDINIYDNSVESDFMTNEIQQVLSSTH